MTHKKINNRKMDELMDNAISSFDMQFIEDKKQKEIIRLMPEIKRHSALVSENETSNEAKIFCRGFVEGAGWRIDSVWHDAKEQPQCDIFFIYENVVHAFHVDGVFPSEDEVFVWDDYVKDWGLIRWAYIKDLIPNKED